MAADYGDGDYLGAYRRFFEDFNATVNPHDQLPVKTSLFDVRVEEVAGEVADMTLQYLNQKYCPPSLQAHMVRLVIEEIKSMCRKQPEECGLRSNGEAFAPLKLMHAVINKINEICLRYMDNSRLALLPPPPSAPLMLSSSYAIKNSRRKMEDQSVVLHDLHTMFSIEDDSLACYYAVFDGHGGQNAAIYCSVHLHIYLVESEHYPTNPALALRDAFLTADRKFIEQNSRENSGTTAVCALLIDKKLYIAWAGDSQASVLENGNVIPLVEPHKPEREDERIRVEKAGGYVVEIFGVSRVNGVLNISRALGDSKHKPYLTGEPDIVTYDLTGNEDFLVIGCDGFWDHVDRASCAEKLYQFIESSPEKYEEASQILVKFAKSRLSFDNISVIVVFLTPPTVIAAKSIYGRSLLPTRMDPDSPQDVQHLASATCPFDLGSGFGKLQQASNGSVPMPGLNFGFEKPSNGSHENGTSRYNDDDDDDDEDDLGPETNVDAVDDAVESYVPVANASRELFPDKLASEDENAEDQQTNVDQSTPAESNDRNQNELIQGADNVAESEDSDDEWRFYRPGNDKADEETKSTAQEEPSVCENETESSCNVKDSFLIDQEEKEEELQQQQQQQQQQEEEVEVPAELETPEAPREVEPVDLIKSDIEVEAEQPSSREEEEDSVTNRDNENEIDEDNMSFHLNPDAAEFVPVTTPPGMRVSPHIERLADFPISGSPLKNRTMDNIYVPSEAEFKKEVCRRPSEINDEELSNGEANSEKNVADFLEEEAQTCQRGARRQIASLLMNLDDADIAPSKAEIGDENSFIPGISEFQKTSGQETDYTFSDMSNAAAAQGEYNIAKDPMAMSFTPGDFEEAFGNDDLNEIHDLSDSETCENYQYNGAETEKAVAELSLDLNHFSSAQKTPEVSSPVHKDDNVSALLDFGEKEKADETNEKDDEEEQQQQQAEHLAYVPEVVSDVQETVKRDDESILNELMMTTKETAAAEAEPVLTSQNPFSADFMPSELERDPEQRMFEHESESELEPKTDIMDTLTSAVEYIDLREEPARAESNPFLSEIQWEAPIAKEPWQCAEATAPEANDREEAAAQIPAACQLGDNIADARYNLASDMANVENFGHVIDNACHIGAQQTQVLPEAIATELDTFDETKMDYQREEEPLSQENQHEKSAHLSESLQEFTKLEKETESLILKEDLAEETKDIVEEPVIREEVKEEPLESSPEFVNSEVVNSEVVTSEAVTPEPATLDVASPDIATPDVATPDVVTPDVATPDDAAPEVVTPEVAAAPQVAEPEVAETKVCASEVEAAIAPAITAAVAATVIAAKTAKSTAAKATKSALSGRSTTNKSTPTSPTKTTAARKPTTTASTGAASKARTTGVSAKPAATAASAKAAPTKSAVSATAPKSTRVTSLTASAPKPKVSTSPRPTEARKPTTNGEAKPISKFTISKPPPSRTMSASMSATSAAKPGLVKSTAPTTRTSSTTATSAAAKPRPTSAMPPKPAARPTTISSSGTSRPKTAPTAPASRARPASTTTTAKSPMIDKQIKETANKQISSAKNAATTASKTNKPLTATTAPGRRLSNIKGTAAPASMSPTKKPITATSRVGSKLNSVQAKVNSKPPAKTKAVVQNGVCETKAPTNVVVATANEEDVPKKDLSPMEPPPTDNQLIITAE